MKKKPPVATRPQQARIDAIRRRIDAGYAGEELPRIAALRREFPHYKPLLALAWEAAQQGDNDIAASLAAWDWTRAAPNNPDAWSALAISAKTHFSALALSAMYQSKALDGHPVTEEPGDIATPFGVFTFEQAVRMDSCRMLMSGGRLDAAEAAIAGIDHISARNNLALVVFARGEPQRALELLEKNWQAAPDNLFALERMIRLRLWTRGMDYAAGLGAPLAATQPLRGDDLRAKLSGLILLNRLEEADAAWRSAQQGQIRESFEMEDHCHYLAACVAWRLGRLSEASARLRAVAKGAMCHAMAQQLLIERKNGETPDWAVGELAAWWPLADIFALQSAKLNTNEKLLEKLERLSPHNDYLERMVELGGEAGRLFALGLLKSRAGNGNVGAIAALKGLLSRPCGPDAVRSSLHNWLVEAGLIEPGALVARWINGEVTTVRNHTLRIVNTPTDDDLPDADAKRYARMLKYHSQGKLDQAEAELSALFAAHPHHPRVLANLAIMRLNLHRPLAEVEILAKHAFEIDPGYAFARIALAYVLIGKGEPKNALEMLAPIMAREEIHIMEYRACLAAQKTAAQTMRDTDTVKRLSRMLKDSETMFENEG